MSRNWDSEALVFATEAHGSQLRKYTGEPYIVHPVAVARIVRTVPHTDAMIAAAYLHDVVEDTPVTVSDISARFGEDVAALVWWLTDVSSPGDGNRKARKALDRAHSAAAPAEAQTIKIADLIDNTRSIQRYDPDFWRVYRHEKIRLLDMLTRGDTSLHKIAAGQVS